jgi:hypothetical protein
MPYEAVDVFCDAASAAKPPVYLGTWAQNKCRLLLFDAFNYAGEVSSRHVVCPG